MTMDPHQQEVAIARFAVIAPLVTRDLPTAEAADARSHILAKRHPFPGGDRDVSRRTLDRWVGAYNAARPNGTIAALAALAPQGRSDRGAPRVFKQEQLEEAIRLRTELKTRSTATLLTHLDDPPKEATLAYHLRRKRATRRLLVALGRACPRYEADAVNATWQSDVKDGMWIPDPTDPSKLKEAHLMGFIDDHSRLIAHGEWYFRESLPCLFDCFRKAILKFGVPAVLYVDNGPVYRSRQLKLLAGRLNNEIIHSEPYYSQGRGKVERFWQTVEGGFMNEASRAGLQTLAELNQHFWAWLDGYQNRIHGTTGMTPLARWEAGAAGIKRVHPADIAEIFWWEDTRLVKKTGTLSLAGNEYHVSDCLVGRTVTVRFDPLDLVAVRVYLDGQFIEQALPYRLVSHTHRKAAPLPKDAKYLPLPSSKRLLANRAQAHQAGIKDELAPLSDIAIHGDRLTGDAWLRLLSEVLGRTVVDAERALVARFFRRYAPLQAAEVSEVLRAAVTRRGSDRHMAFYLDEVAMYLAGGRS